MSLFISNSTLQHHLFSYRDPATNRVVTLEIGSGKQVEVGHAWNAEQKAKVIAELDRFGARDAAEVYGQLKKFHGLLYRDSDPIDADEIKAGHDAVVETAEERSATEATRSALAFDRSLNPEKGHRRTKLTEIEVEQLMPPNEHPTGDEVNMSIAVDPEQGRSDVTLPV